MVNTVLYIAANTLDMLLAALIDRTSAIIFFAIHNNSSFAKNIIMVRKKQLIYSPNSKKNGKGGIHDGAFCNCRSTSGRQK